MLRFGILTCSDLIVQSTYCTCDRYHSWTINVSIQPTWFLLTVQLCGTSKTKIWFKESLSGLQSVKQQSSRQTYCARCQYRIEEDSSGMQLENLSKLHQNPEPLQDKPWHPLESKYSVVSMAEWRRLDYPSPHCYENSHLTEKTTTRGFKAKSFWEWTYYSRDRVHSMRLAQHHCQKTLSQVNLRHTSDSIIAGNIFNVLGKYNSQSPTA